MDKTKAAEIVGILVANDFEPTIKRDNSEPPNFTITVASQNGTLINALKVFQDNNQVIIKARVIEIS